jgi:cyclopropane fatty-acyl-phospholipid synthase-like methyltransferase
MGHYDTKEGVEEYIKHSEKWNGKQLIKILLRYLPESSTLLELGMGPGRDFEVLRKAYLITGSDSSQVFLDRYKEKNKEADLLKLDAVTIPTKRKFDCIYSNKVLQHLTKEDLKKSLERQKEILNPNGIVFHALWRGDKIEEKKGLLFIYYQIDELKKIIGEDFDILDIQAFTEIEKNDSIYFILSKVENSESTMLKLK